jgi:SOS response regulatory protein OraA/RecX
MRTAQSPSTFEIHETIDLIQKKIDSGSLSEEVKEGYEEALNILVHRKRSYKEIDPALNGKRGAAIAVMAVDYLAGEVEQKVLVGIVR